MLTSIKGKSVLVTGSSKGIGKGIARVFAHHGGQVMIVSRHQEEAQATADEINKAGGAAAAVAGDVSKWEDCQKIVQATADAFGGLDILCSNAGIFPSHKIEEMNPEQWDEVVDTNLKGTFMMVKAAVPYLKQRDTPRIVLTSSITGPITGFPGWTHYGASKGGINGFLRTAAIELAKYKITVNAVMPGNVKTEGLDGMGEDYLRQMAASIPLKELGEVEDIGNAALFLASKEAGYITGQTIVVDGGQVLPESLEALEEA